MIEIKLLEEGRAVEACADCGCVYGPRTFVYAATQGDESFGVCIFEMEGEAGRILCIRMREAGLAPIADGLLRSAMSLMVVRGVRKAECAAVIEPALLRRAGFREQGGVYSTALSETFFAGCEK